MHKRFTDDEIQKLWDNCYKMHNVDAILIEIYTAYAHQNYVKLNVKR